MQERILLHKLMQQDVHRRIIKYIVNAQPATPSATAGTVTQPTCATATGSFQITGYSASNTILLQVW
jgi:hypothetical protein